MRLSEGNEDLTKGKADLCVIVILNKDAPKVLAFFLSPKELNKLWL